MSLPNTNVIPAPVEVDNTPNTQTDMTGLQSTVMATAGSGHMVVSTGYDMDNLIILSGDSAGFADSTPFPGSTLDHIMLRGNNESASLGGGGNVIDAYGTAQITVSNTLDAGANAPLNSGNRVNAIGGGDVSVSGGGSGFVFDATNGTGTYLVDGNGASSATINGGAGGGTFIGGQFIDARRDPAHTTPLASNMITAGDSSSTLYGSQYGKNVLDAKGSATDVLIAGEYAQTTESAVGSTGNNSLEGYLGQYVPPPNPNLPSTSTVMMAGDGNDTLIGGSGSTIMVSGNGQDVFAFFNNVANQVFGGNTDAINGFVSGQDKVYLGGFGQSADQVFAGATLGQDGGTVLHLSDGTTVSFTHQSITAADITVG